MIPPRRPPPSICLVPVHSAGCFAESMGVPRKRGVDRISRLSHAIFSAPPPSPLPEVKGWESQTNGPCVSPPCVCMQRHGQASCQVLLLFPRRLKKKKTNPKLPSPPLPSFTSTPRSPLHPLFLSLEHKGKAELLNLNVPRLGRADDEDDRAEVRDEGADLRRSGCYFTGQDSVPSAAEATPAGTRSGILRFHSFGSLSVSYAFNGGIV